MQERHADTPDAYWVRKTLDGAPEAFGPLVERHQGAIYNLMLRFCRDRGTADELAQEVFLKAYDKLGTLGRGQSFFSWLYSIGYNLGRDWTRRRDRSPFSDAPDALNLAPDHAPPHDEALIRRERLRRLEAGLRRLPERSREALVLRYRHDASLAEVASALDIGLSAAKMRIKRGMEQLAALLAEDDHDER